MIAGFAEFEFDLPSALLESLIAVLQSTVVAPLDAVHVNSIPDAQGVYQLFHRGALVYVGKTDAEAGMRKRLKRHAEKVQHRIGLEPGDVSFKAIRVFVFTAIDLETQLIRAAGGSAWNGSGFGSNDPGRERDTTRYKENHFDALFPIDIDRDLPLLKLAGLAPVNEILEGLRRAIPYVFRFQNAGGTSRKSHIDLTNPVAFDPAAARSTRAILQAVVPQLPAGWRAIKLPSHVILYNDERSYPSGEEIARSGAGHSF